MSLLELSKVDHLNKQRYIEVIDLTKVINYTVNVFEVMLFEDEFKTEFSVEDNLLINGDKDLLKQLLFIMVDNAIKHNNQEKKLSLKAFSKGDYVYVEIKNSSEYLNQQAMAKLFDRFYQADQSRSKSGFGLGLPLAKGIIDQHKGTVTTSYDAGIITFSMKFDKVSKS